MDAAEAADALAMCAAYDNRTPTRIAADAWAAALPDIRFEDARVAIVDHYSSSREWLMPADIRDAVRALRNARLATMPTPVPPESIDPDDIPKTLAWERAYRAAWGDGHDAETADRVACATVNVTRPQLDASPRPVAPAIETIAQSLPRIPRATRKAS